MVRGNMIKQIYIDGGAYFEPQKQAKPRTSKIAKLALAVVVAASVAVKGAEPPAAAPSPRWLTLLPVASWISPPPAAASGGVSEAIPDHWSTTFVEAWKGPSGYLTSWRFVNF